MLAHKLDGEHPASYSDLLLAAWKLERQAEVRDPLPPKTAMTNGSTRMHSQTPGNLFPLCKLKGNCRFATHVATIGNDVAEEDPGVEPEGEEETESSADEEVETLGEVKEVDQPIENIADFAKAVELYQKENKNCFRCGSPDHFIQDCLKDVSRPTQKVYLNMKEGMAKKRGWAPHKLAAPQRASLAKMPQAWGHHERFASWTETHSLIAVGLKT